MNINDICKRLRTAREGVNLNAKQMAEKLSVEYSTYKKYESRSPLRQDLIVAFCKITDINEKWLLTGEGNMSNGDAVSDDFKKLETSWNELLSENKDELLNFTDSLLKVQKAKDKLK